MSQPGERTVIVDDPPPARAPGTSARALLAWVLRGVDAGPRPFFQAALVSLAATCCLGILIAFEIRPPGPLPWQQHDVIFISLGGLALVVISALVTVLIPASVRATVLNRVVAPQQRAAIWLALTIWFPLLDIIAYYRTESTLPLTVRWIAFGYLDKRWMTAAYLLGALAPMVLLVGASRVLEAGRKHPASWGAWLRDLAPHRQPGPLTANTVAANTVAATSVISDTAGADTVVAKPVAASPAAASTGVGSTGVGSTEVADTGPRHARTRATAAATTGAATTGAATTGAGDASPGASPERFPSPGFIRVVAGLLTALGLAYYFYGPPWYLSRTSGSLSIGYQEDLYLGGLQAISKGAVPYIGPAAIQYGPGSQWFSYEYMRHFATFSVVGFRESWAMFEWVGASLLFVVFFLAFGYFRGLVAALMSALIYPALQEMEFVPHGAYSGLYGWASPLRYAGAISLLLLLPAAIRRAPAWRGVLGAFVLGLIWGLLSYVAQENLVAGAVGAIVLSALLLFAGSASVRSVVTSLVAVLAGFVVSWLPVVSFYAGKGLLGRFVYLYFMDPLAVAQWYSNTPYGWPRAGKPPVAAETAISGPWKDMYHILPFLLALLALLAILQFRPFRVAMDWSKDRIMLVAVVLTTILLYQGAMLRADGEHLTGTLLVVPLLVVAVATTLPRLLGALKPRTLGFAGVLIFAVSFLLLPLHAYKLSSVGDQAAAPALDRARLAAEKGPRTPHTLADLRIGAGLWHRPACCQSDSEPMRNFIKLANRIHKIIGNRVTYVQGFAAGYPGIILFVADLRPAPVPLDLRTMVFTDQAKRQYVADYKRSVLPHVQAVVTSDLQASEVREFELRYPNYRTFTLYWRHSHPYYVLLS